MKYEKTRGKRPAVPALALTVLLLTLCVTVTTPITWSKYTAGASRAGTGTVAKWNVTYPSSPANNGVAIWYTAQAPSTNVTNNNTRSTTFQVKNESQVAADISLKVTYVEGKDDVPGWGSNKETNVSIAASGTLTGVTQITTVGDAHITCRFEPGATATFTMTFTKLSMGNYVGYDRSRSSASRTLTLASHKCKLFANAVQVD